VGPAMARTRARGAGQPPTRSSAACTRRRFSTMTAPDRTPVAHAAHGGRGHRRLSHLDALESESIHVIREVAAEFERPVLLFSGGKDSAVMLRLAQKAFSPAPIPFPVLHGGHGHHLSHA